MTAIIYVCVISMIFAMLLGLTLIVERVLPELPYVRKILQEYEAGQHLNTGRSSRRQDQVPDEPKKHHAA